MLQVNQNLKIREVDSSEITQLLKDSELPTSDISPRQSIFLAAFIDNDLVGCVGLERIGELGLLRSLAVQPEYQKWELGENSLMK